MKKKCECDKEGILQPGMSGMYHPALELPYVNHKPGKCKCTNELKQYISNGKKRWMCSNCVMPGDKEV